MATIEVRNNEDRNRFEAYRDGRYVGFIDYRISGDIIDLPHTRVFPEYEGQGIGPQLVKHSMDLIRDMDGALKVKPTCPFIDKWMKLNKEYEDLRA